MRTDTSLTVATHKRSVAIYVSALFRCPPLGPSPTPRPPLPVSTSSFFTLLTLSSLTRARATRTGYTKIGRHDNGRRCSNTPCMRENASCKTTSTKRKTLRFSLTLVIGQGFRPVPPSFESLRAVRLHCRGRGEGSTFDKQYGLLANSGTDAKW